MHRKILPHTLNYSCIQSGLAEYYINFNSWRRFGTTPWERHCVFAYKFVCFEDVFHDWSGCIFDAIRWDARLGVYSLIGTPDLLILTLRVCLVLKFGLSWAWWWISPGTNMTPTRRRRRVSKYIILVNTVGAVVGAKLSYIYFININQLLNASKWRTDRGSSPVASVNDQLILMLHWIHQIPIHYNKAHNGQ